MANTEMKQEAGNNSELYQAEYQTVNRYVVEQPKFNAANALVNLIEAYKKEMNSPQQSSTGEFIEKLNFFMTTFDNEFMTLEQKLEAGGFSSDIAMARKLKQNYAMTLQKIKHINSAQKIHAYLLGMVLVNFSYAYQFLSKKKAERPENTFIKSIIDTKVITPVENLLNSADNALEIYHMDIHAMIYYLTGNCHIKWN
jgi:hypothetical protein